MDKQDILVVVIAVACISVMALVVKPMLPVYFPQGSPGITVTPAPTWVPATSSAPATPALTPSTPAAATPTPRPTWDGSVKQVTFLNSSGDQTLLSPSPTIPPDVAPNRSMITYAVISGRWSGTTENLYIPAPSWIMEYTADPIALPPDVFPRLIIQVFDVRDPNREVRVINQDIYEEQPEDPWVEKFYEGKKEYSFRISSRFLKSYTITIKVPLQYT